MARASMLAGLRGRPIDEEEEEELEAEEAEAVEEEAVEEDAEERPAQKKASTRKASTRKGQRKPTPAEVHALDERIYQARDAYEAKHGRAPTSTQIADLAKVPGPTVSARKQRVNVALRRRGSRPTPKAAPKAPAARRTYPGPRALPRSAGPATVVVDDEDLLGILRTKREKVAATLAKLDAAIEALS